MTETILIVGAGQAGLQIAESLRADGYDGRLVMIGDETWSPYQRPPLSKAFLSGDMNADNLIFRSDELLASRKIELLTNRRVASIDRTARNVTLDDGSTLAYTGLALATGSRARALPIAGGSLAGVVPLRGIDDALHIKSALATAERIVVIGGGFIGLEVAASARKAGKTVTVLEAADRLMARAVTPLISEFFLKVHRAKGVDVELGAKVTSIGGTTRATSVHTADGRAIPADLVIVGIGILPNAELAEAAGLACNNGIVVDACSRTSDPHVVAAGDCTARFDAALQTWFRFESVQNAVEQGKAAAAALLGKERPFVAAPWFWSDQYECKLQMTGLSAGVDRAVIRGSQAEQRFSAFYFRDDRMIAVDSVNRPQDHMAARKMLDRGIGPTPEQASDESFNFATLLK